MNRMTVKWTRPGSGYGLRKRQMGVFSVILLLLLSLNACGASSWERLRASGSLSNGEVILGETGIVPDAAGSVAGNFDLIAGESVNDPSASPATGTAASQFPAEQPGSSADMRPTPVPDELATPEPKQASANAGIIVWSENILSTSEKEALLNELEKELSGLFGAINRVSAEQQAGQAE